MSILYIYIKLELLQQKMLIQTFLSHFKSEEYKLLNFLFKVKSSSSNLFGSSGFHISLLTLHLNQIVKY